MRSHEDLQRAARQCLRRLILPVTIDGESQAVDALIDASSSIGLEVNDLADFIDVRVREWEQCGQEAADFAQLVGRVLGAIACAGSDAIRSRYFDLHRVALADPAGLSHLQGRQLLSHLPLMTTLCSTERMSASQIARVLKARDSRVTCSWVAIRRILETTGVYHDIEFPRFKDLFEADLENEESFFADSTLEECLKAVADLGSKLGLSADTFGNLRILLPENEAPLYSTLEMLHYQLMIAEFQDHALTFTYEHKPRGGAMNWLHDQYPDSIKAGKQPFLNIAKSLYRISEDWALARDRPKEAVAMTRLLEDVESLGFAAKREIAEKIRWLIQRYIKRFSGMASFIPNDFPIEAIRVVADSVARSPSRSFGILEQRLADAMAIAIHSSQAGWHAAVIGQSVFASNRSAKKFGDCEFLNHGENQITAYEAHGGKATRWYLNDHLLTLPATVAARLAVLEENFDIDQLKVKVVFVAHEYEPNISDVLKTRVIDGISFDFEACTFTEMMSDAGRGSLDEALAQHFAAALNNSAKTTTPQRVRDRFFELSGNG